MGKNIKRVMGLLLSIAMLCGILPMTAMAEDELVNYGWIEGETCTDKNGSSSSSICTDARASDGEWLSFIGGGAAYWAAYTINVDTAQTYDIFVKGADEKHGTVDITYTVNNAEVTHTQVTESTDSGNKYVAHNGNHMYVKWYKLSVPLNAGDNTLKITFNKVSGQSSTWGGVDAIAFLPEGTGYAPTTVIDPEKDKICFYLNTLLLEEDLDNVTEDIALPTVLADGTAVTWTSDNTDVLGIDGAVTIPEENTVVQLTATAGSCSKIFEVTVKKEGGSGTEPEPDTPVLPAIANCGWIEGETCTDKNGSSSSSICTDTRASDGKWLSFIGSGNAYYAAYTLSVDTAQTYDIFVKGADEKHGTVDITYTVNDAEVTYTPVTESTDSGNKYVAHNGNHMYVKWYKLSVPLNAGDNTLKITFNKVSGQSSTWGGVDAIAFLPEGTGYAPTTVIDPEIDKTNFYSTITNGPAISNKINISVDVVTWIDAKDAARNNGVTFITNDTLNGGEGATVKKSTAPTEPNQYYLEFALDVKNEAEYDIFLRGSSDRNVWNSEPTISVNGTDYEITDMGYDEGWVNDEFNVAWSKIENVTMPFGDNTLKWIVKTSRTTSTEYYISVFDAFVILPHGTPFKPVSKDLANTKLDAELSIMLAGENILNPKENVSLPSATYGGKNILWSTSDAGIFDTNGNITRGWYDIPVTVTAVLGNNEYTRVFDVLVSKLVEFTLDGELNVGDTSVNATVYFGEEAVDKDATIIFALYRADGTLKQFNSDEKSFSQQDNYIDINMSLNRAVAEGDTFVVFVWDNLTNLEPLSPKLTLGNKFLLKPFVGDVSFHTKTMQAYLNDSYDSIAEYADGSKRADNPLPITFRWSWIGMDTAPNEYTLKLSESPDMGNPKVYTAQTEACEVYNLKVDTKYYWTVSAEDANGNVITSDIATFKTADKAPRNIYVGGGFNTRDIGGWDTLDGSQVKQGYLYRSGRLNYISSSDGITLKNQVNSSGIDTMVNDLGIKTEIDIRLENEMPLEYTESVLGKDINYVRAPMNYDGDYLLSNKDSIKEVFETLSNPENYPIVYHCAAGADRTGAITYLVNGLLGVSQEDLFRDYLITNFTSQGFRPLSNIENLYVKTVDEYRGDTLSEKIYNYLSEVIEVPTEQLDFIIEYLK